MHEWLRHPYQGKTAIFFGGLKSGECTRVTITPIATVSEIDELFCSTKEETDDRLVMHLVHGCNAGITSALVYSPDTDVFLSMLYHYMHSFTGLEHLYIKMEPQRERERLFLFTY